ncbi:MAG: DUF5666 domain-containing protein [Actinomycetota bacterium]|nr:DUF5666 domain-containing protein [Actinomycetota bacterium]
MKSTHHIAGRVIAWTAVATLGVGVIAGAAVAATGTDKAPSAAPSSATSTSGPGKGDPAKDDGRHKGLLARRAVHGEFVVKGKDGKYVTTAAQRGAVTAVSPTSISVRSEDGFTATYAINADTRIRKAGEKAAISAVKVGDTVMVLAVKEADGKTARGLIVGAKR